MYTMPVISSPACMPASHIKSFIGSVIAACACAGRVRGEPLSPDAQSAEYLRVARSEVEASSILHIAHHSEPRCIRDQVHEKILRFKSRLTPPSKHSSKHVKLSASHLISRKHRLQYLDMQMGISEYSA